MFLNVIFFFFRLALNCRWSRTAKRSWQRPLSNTAAHWPTWTAATSATCRTWAMDLPRGRTEASGLRWGDQDYDPILPPTTGRVRSLFSQSFQNCVTRNQLTGSFAVFTPAEEMNQSSPSDWVLSLFVLVLLDLQIFVILLSGFSGFLGEPPLKIEKKETAWRHQWQCRSLCLFTRTTLSSRKLPCSTTTAAQTLRRSLQRTPSRRRTPSSHSVVRITFWSSLYFPPSSRFPLGWIIDHIIIEISALRRTTGGKHKNQHGNDAKSKMQTWV